MPATAPRRIGVTNATAVAKLGTSSVTALLLRLVFLVLDLLAPTAPEPLPVVDPEPLVAVQGLLSVREHHPVVDPGPLLDAVRGLQSVREHRLVVDPGRLLDAAPLQLPLRYKARLPT